MAQVYQLVDENGVTRLFVEIVPDPTGTPFNGGTITAPLGIDGVSDVVQLTVKGVLNQSNNNLVEFDRSTGSNLWTLDNNGAVSQTIRSGNIGQVLAFFADSRQIGLGVSSTQLFQLVASAGATVFEVHDDGGIVTRGAKTSGALSTTTFVSGTGKQIDTTSDRELIVPVTFNPGVATISTCTVALSPDNSTYSTLVVATKPVGTVFDGEIDPIALLVPAAWYVKLTVVNATIGTATYY